MDWQHSVPDCVVLASKDVLIATRFLVLTPKSNEVAWGIAVSSSMDSCF